MIVTPKELEKWSRSGKDLTVLDIRPKKQIREFPLVKLNHIKGTPDTIKNLEGEIVLICQFGIITEGMIIENNLNNTYSLLGGVQAWNDYLKENNDLSRWSRQTSLQEIGIEGQKKIMDAKIAIVGMGGLGCPAAKSLAAAGIGALNIIDGDTVELSNLHRQHLYQPRDVGKKKVNIAKKALEKISDNTKIKTFDFFLNQSNGVDCFDDVNIIIDATDNISSRRLIDQYSRRFNIPMVYGSLYKFEGQVGVFNTNGSIGYSALFPGQVSGGKTCEEAGVLGMLPSIIGNIQALEVIKLIINLKPNLIGRLLIYDGLQHTTEVIEL